MSVRNANLLLEFIFDKQSKIPFFNSPFPIQGMHIHYGISIKNIGDKEFPGGTISKLVVKHMGTEIAVQSSDTKTVPKIMPGKKVNIWVTNTILNYPGPIWVSCDIKANDSEITVKPFQCSRGEENGIPLSLTNSWSHSEYVQPRLEYLQSLTNYIILFLTIVIAIETIIGFSNIYNVTGQIIEYLWLTLKGLIPCK
jgi:hypothetical protein